MFMNNNPRFYLWLALAAVLWLNYTAWQREFPPHPAAPAAASGQSAPVKQPGSLANSIPQTQPAASSAAPRPPTPRHRRPRRPPRRVSPQ